VSSGFAGCDGPLDRRQRSRDDPRPTHFSFEPFPKSADLFKKRAVPYPPLPQRKPRFPQAGLSLFVRGRGRAEMPGTNRLSLGSIGDGKSTRVSDIRRHSRLWLLDYFRFQGRIARHGADMACGIGAGAGGGRTAQPFQRNSQYAIEGHDPVPRARSEVPRAH
jgi:hypothetical protein